MSCSERSSEQVAAEQQPCLDQAGVLAERCVRVRVSMLPVTTGDDKNAVISFDVVTKGRSRFVDAAVTGRRVLANTGRNSALSGAALLSRL
jgi:hypothetical protein